MSFLFSQENQIEFEALLSQYPDRKAALLPVLWLVQKQMGYVSLEAQEYVADCLGLSPAAVYSVVSFYTMFRRKPTGKYHLQCCRTLSCALNRAEDIVRHLKEKYKLEEGMITADGLLSLELVECLASCGTGPVVMVNDSLIEHVTIEKLDKVIEKLKAER